MMRLFSPACLSLLSLLGALASGEDVTPKAALSLWYDKPADYTVRTTEDGGYYKTLIDEAVLIGNGRLGAMIQGRVDRELLRLSENTLWTGGVNPDGDYRKNMGRFQRLGDLSIALTGQQLSPEQYRRSLDLNNALAAVSYTANGITYRREYFASYPDQVMAVRLTASRPGSYSGAISYTDGHERISRYAKNRITAAGGLPNGLRYETQVLVLNEGGSQKVAGEPNEERIEFS